MAAPLGCLESELGMDESMRLIFGIQEMISPGKDVAKGEVNRYQDRY